METVFYTMAMVLLWVLNLVKSTGFGLAYNILEITKILCVATTLVFALRKLRRMERAGAMTLEN